MDRSHIPEIERLERMADKLDRAFRIPGTQIRFGWDSLLGFIPGLGDTATLLPSGYIVAKAHRMGAPRHLVMRMGMNVGIDWLIGLIPVVGDIFDVGWKANRRNVKLLRGHVERLPEAGDGALSSHHPEIGAP